MFRIRKSYWGGTCILQHSEGSRWVDHIPAPALAAGFHIVGIEYLDYLHVAVSELDAIKQTRSEAVRKGNVTRKAKKNAPVLTSPLSGPGSYEAHSIYTRRR